MITEKLTIRVENLASHVRGAMVAGKKDIRWSNLNGLTSPSHRHLRPELSTLFLVERCRNQWRPDGSGGDPIDAYASLYELES